MNFPARPVRYIVPFRAGGPPHAIAAIVTEGLQALWGQPVQVENRPGANGIAGTELVAASPPDGHTLLQGSSATHASNALLFPMLHFDPRKVLVPVAALIEGPLYLGAGAAQPFGTVQSLVDHARANPGAVRFATAGPGSPQHLAGELLRVKAGVDIAPVHYAGAAQALEALVRGDVEIYFGSDFPAHPDAAVKLLGVSTRWRWPFASHVPTLVECGIANFEIHGWFGVFAPAATPPAVVERINAGVNEVLASARAAQQIRRFGYRVPGGTPADFAAQIEQEVGYWTTLVRTHGLSLA